MSATGTDGFDSVLGALSDPTRRAIVRRLANGDATVLELAEPFAISLPAISRHLKVLEHAGLISRGRDGQRRPCRLRPEPLLELATWAQNTHTVWEQRLDRLDAHLQRTRESAEPGTKRMREPKREPKREQGTS